MFVPIISTRGMSARKSQLKNGQAEISNAVVAAAAVAKAEVAAGVDGQESMASLSSTGAATNPSSKARSRGKRDGEEGTPDKRAKLTKPLVYPMPPAQRRHAVGKARSTQGGPSAAKDEIKTENDENKKTLLTINTNGSIKSSQSLKYNGHMNTIEEVDTATTRFILMNDQKQDNIVVPCSCQEKPQLTTSKTEDGKPLLCQAMDAFDGKIIGCANQTTLRSLFRPSRTVQYKVLCEVHLARLRRHHCCPGCGMFCSQGEFLECFAVKKQVHLFHKDCQPVSNVGAKKQQCPHCTQVSPERSVRLEMNGPVENSVYYVTQTPVLKTPRAKMSLTKLKELPAVVASDDLAADPGIEVTIPDTQKVLSLSGVPIGPDRKQLEELLSKLAEDSIAQTIRFSNKNFYNTVKSGDVDKALSLLAQGFDPNHKFMENEGETPLHAAATEGHLVIAHLLIQAGADLNAQNDMMNTPLMNAVGDAECRGCQAVVKYLVHAGAAIDIRGEDGMTALHMAARAGNLEAVVCLLRSSRISINIQDDGGWTPLVWAIEHKHLALVKQLIAKGADPSIMDDEENIGLHWAAYSGDATITYILLDIGCDVNAHNVHGDTSLHIASRRDNYECVVLLLSRGADLTLQNKNSETAVACAQKSSQSQLALRVNEELKRYAGIRKLESDRPLHRDISKGKESVQIPIVNGVDDEPLPIDYMYVTENCETTSVNIDRAITSLQGCRCDDDCTSDGCECSNISFRCWYDREGKLTDEFNLHDAPMIFECNRACACWKTCYNRNVQFGVRSRLQVYRAAGKGWGVRPLRDIAKGTFVCEYVGEIISDSEADRRDDDSYLFDLDNKVSKFL